MSTVRVGLAGRGPSVGSPRSALRGMTVTSLETTMPEYKTWADATAPVLAKAEQTLSKEIMAPVRRQLGR